MPLKKVRDKFYENFGNYRLGITWDNDRRRSFRPLEGDAPVIFKPENVDGRQPPFRPGISDRIDLDAIEDLAELQGDIQKAHSGLQRLKDYITSRSNGERFVYQRCLGWGGYGLATVFDVYDEDGRRIRGIVIHARSEHILQLAEAERELLDQEEDAPVKAAPAKKRRRKAAYEPRRRPQKKQAFPAIMLELLENGDLSHFIIKVRERKDTIPNRVLWRFFLCLVRMCIGLAYPPDRIQEYNDLPGPITETVPGQLRNNPSRIVHFDMDPRNIFIGDFVGEEHRLTPLLKLGDFGLATEIQDDKMDSYYEYFRNWGKLGFLAPEQFCLDWDYIPRGRNKTVCDHPIAGNYRWHTNVWCIGLIMECLVTLCYPRIPPTPTESTAAKPKNKPKYWTYGGHLLGEEYAHVDRMLRTTIMRCQANFPEDRPKLHALEAFLSSKIKKDRGGLGVNSDEFIADWIHTILYDPPPRASSAEPDAPGPSPAPGPTHAHPQPRPASVGGPVRQQLRRGWARHIHPYERPQHTF
ncbi:kinase-like domain-containing protein [Nemania sp. NC0429]|nr:kinase-like domain-containing protein [Nemania sp. NC0429]